MKQDRYHIHFKNRRTTITVDRVISELLAIKLQVLPDAPETHSLLRTWFEELLHDKLGENVPGGSRVSQDARQYAIEALVDKKLMNELWDWRLGKSNPDPEKNTENDEIKVGDIVVLRSVKPQHSVYLRDRVGSLAEVLSVQQEFDEYLIKFLGTSYTKWVRTEHVTHASDEEKDTLPGSPFLPKPKT